MPHKILIVDDDELIQQLVALQLQSEGYQTTAVLTGGAMFAALAAQQFDLIVLDLGLPDGDGLTIAQHLRTKSTIPIIVVTARQGSDDRVMALGIGVNDYVVKPFDPRELSLRISNILKPIGPVYADGTVPGMPPHAAPVIPPVYPAVPGQYQPQPVGYTPVPPQVPPQVSPLPGGERRGSRDERRDRRENPEARAKHVKRRIKYILLGTMAVALSVLITTFLVSPDSPLSNQQAQPTQGTDDEPVPLSLANPPQSQDEEKVVTVTLESPNSSGPEPALTDSDTSSRVVPGISTVDDSWIKRVICEDFPEVDWWQIKSHSGVVRYVRRKHGGNFGQYYDSWSERLTKMQEILNRDSGAITRTQVVLRGEDLKNYILRLEKRLEIINCLSQAAVIADPATYKSAK